MVLLQDGLLAFLSAVGMTTVVWLMAGALLRLGAPTPQEFYLVLPLRGQAPALESELRQLRRVQSQYPGGRILLADCGLDRQARDLAAYLADREAQAALIDIEALSEAIS